MQRPLARVTPGNPTLSNLINMEIDRDSWLAQLRFRIGAVNNGWNQWVLNYDKENRRNLVAWLEETFGNWRALAGLALACGLIAVARARRGRREIDPVDALYSALSEQMSRSVCGAPPTRDRTTTRGASPPQRCRPKRKKPYCTSCSWSAHTNMAPPGPSPISPPP
ncbi:hypothetical protein LP419_08000 [Massilia sp. H-1]|nr:hypothetical protein LP419_08000 [Massilia sp. H-1]